MSETRTYSDDEIGKILQSWDNCRTSANPRDWYVATDIAEAIIRQLRAALDAARAENAATAVQIEIAKRLLPPLDETPAETAMLDAIFGTPTVGEESRAFWGDDE